MLDGIKVLDFSHYIPGPFASLRLADFGAEVVKIEPPSGDLARSEEFDYVFQANNANKKSILLNLKDQHDLEMVEKLIRKADILIEGFRPGVMKRLGLAYDDVKKINEKIIYCSITGYGQQGELAALGSHDINYVSLSGVLAQLKDRTGRPIHPSITLADMIGSMAAVEQILAALYARERTGKGMYIDISLLDGLLAMMNNHFIIEHYSGYPKGVEQLAGTIVSYCIYETKDGRFVSLAALERKFWEHFCIASQKREWLHFHQSPANENNPIFVDICQWFKSKTLAEWIEFGRKVDCCLTPVLEVHEAKEWFSKEHNRKMVDIHNGGIHIATRYDPQIFHKRAQAPKLDEHRQEIIEKWTNA
ncbi:CaiB/BaiF CoA transferase family protein [Paranoxybacillus vitaminiphilus]|uniref:CaiB/BaiF CoA transferase family protein n=1 Tax=Paranoxybacillus vitaminiphilus TaxID=581036 RepID=UPI000DB94730|nr:CaiB/BaiF CoA-transferase family protein [Anoxybacillus vitaminiphilus]